MWLPKLVLLFLTLALLQPQALAIKKSYVVYLGAHSHLGEASLAGLQGVADSHHEFLASFLGSTVKAKEAIFYSYEHHINGFAAMLEEEEAAEIAKNPNVVSVFLNKARQLHTTHSWEFMSLEKDDWIHSASIWRKARFGQDTIIASLDSGVWPESKSFSDRGYGPVPSKWKGSCQNDTALGVRCNKKLIGASFYGKGNPNISLIDPIQYSARDFEGHGSHTLSTAGGNFVPGANLFGVANGTAKGGSPKARVAMYKVCWPRVSATDGGCYDADILKAFDVAIHDGADVISLSLGGDPDEYFNDSISIGSFHAIKKGIVVVCSAGNSGPSLATVTNVSPWVITVGASTIDRDFPAYVELRDGQRFKGLSISKPLPEARLYPLVNGTRAKYCNARDTDALLCKEGSLDPMKAKDKIVVCLRGENDRVQKSHAAFLAGAAGMILCNAIENGNDIVADIHMLPAVHINYKDGVKVMKYINSSDDPLGFITAPSSEFGVKPAPKMASFSSNGPNTVTPEILKPDVTAPGVDILAAYTEAKPASDHSFDKRKTPYALMSGTSMSCPHVSGVAALLKILHPEWSPSAIKSAIMTTARVRDDVPGVMQDSHSHEATPFNYGNGHIRPNRAQDPGLVYDLTPDDYLNFLCALGYNKTMVALFSRGSFKCPNLSSNALLDFNYPSITVPHLSGSVTVTRKLKNVGSPGKYRARVHHPLGVVVTVEPSFLEFKKKGEEKSFKVTLKPKGSKGISKENYVFGELVWSDGYHYVRSSITVSNIHGSHQH